jgi:hypothetical protein
MKKGKAKTELGMEVDVVHAKEEALRGNYDVTRLQRDHPQLVSLITWLVSLPGMTYQAIAKQAGIGWESVAAIAATRKSSIREFKLRMADTLALVLEAAAPGLLAKAAKGALTPLEFKLLTDAWLLLAGEATSISKEIVEDPKRAELRRFLAQAGTGAGMVLEGEEIVHRAAALPEAGAGAGGLGLPLPAVRDLGDHVGAEMPVQSGGSDTASLIPPSQDVEP